MFPFFVVKAQRMSRLHSRELAFYPTDFRKTCQQIGNPKALRVLNHASRVHNFFEKFLRCRSASVNMLLPSA